MGEVLLAGEKAQEWPACLCNVIADRPLKHWIAIFERVQNGSKRNWPRNFKLHFALDARQVAQMKWQDHSDHLMVWTSTDKTAGKSWTIVDQLSPPLAER